MDHGSVRHDGIDRVGNARPGPVRVRDFHHGDDADPARDTARTIGTSDELPDVAGGGVAGDLDVRGWSGGGKGWDQNLYYGSAAMLVGIGVVGYFKLPKAENAEAEKAESAKAG
jgi:hypothetical protein